MVVMGHKIFFFFILEGISFVFWMSLALGKFHFLWIRTV